MFPKAGEKLPLSGEMASECETEGVRLTAAGCREFIFSIDLCNII